MAEQETYASLLPADADVSGFLDGVEATITMSRTALFDYNGQVQPAVPAIAVQYHVDGAAKQGTPQHYTAGKPDHRVPSEDGTRFKTFGAKKGLPKDSNALKFVLSILNAGFPADKMSDDVSIFEGMKVLLRSEAQEKREGGDGKDRTIILVDKILSLPWENKATGAKGVAPKAAAKSTAAKPAAAVKPTAAAKPAAVATVSPMEDDDAKQAAIGAVQELLADAKNGGTIPKAKLGPLSFRILAQNPNRLNATKLLSQLASDFLPTCDAFFGFDGENVVALEA